MSQSLNSTNDTIKVSDIEWEVLVLVFVYSELSSLGMGDARPVVALQRPPTARTHVINKHLARQDIAK